MEKTIANQSVSNVLGRAAQLLRILEEAGLPFEAWQIPIDDPEKRRQLVEFWKSMGGSGEFVPFPNVSFYDVWKVNELFSLRLTEEQMREIGHPPEPIRGFITFYDPGWSIKRMSNWDPQLFKLDGCGWTFEEEFFDEMEDPCYRQIRLQAVPYTYGRSLEDQLPYLPEGEEVPKARQLVTAMVIRLLSGGACPFDQHVRSSTKTMGKTVNVGEWKGLISLKAEFPGRVFDYLGLAAARKS